MSPKALEKLNGGYNAKNTLATFTQGFTSSPYVKEIKVMFDNKSCKTSPAKINA